MKTKSSRRVLKDKAPDLPDSAPRMSNAERCRRYRVKRMKDPLYRESEKLRQQLRRMDRTDIQKERDRENARLRMQKLREKRQKLKVDQDVTGGSKETTKTKKPVTRHQCEAMRQKWREAKKKYRANLSAQKKRRIREADRARKSLKVQSPSARKSLKVQSPSPKSPSSNDVSDVYSPEAARKAVYRAKRKLPNDPQKYAQVLKGLLVSASPMKRKAIEMELPQVKETTPRKKRRTEFLQRAMGAFKEEYHRLKESRKSNDCKTRKVLATHLARVRKSRLLRFCSNELGIRYKSLLKWSKLDPSSKSKRSDALSDDLVQDIRDFYIKPTISYTHSTKKTVYKKQMKQRHTLNYPLRTVHKQFKESHQSRVSFSKFASLKPKNVETFGKRLYRGCLCEKCTNIELQLKTINRRLDKDKRIKDKYDANHLTLCEYEKGSHPKLQCVKRECERCGTKKVRDMLQHTSESEEAVWHQWETKKVTNEKTGLSQSRKMLVQHVGQFEVLIESFIENLESFSDHLFVAQWQYQQFLKAKEGLAEGHVLAVMDFAENMTLRNQEECQSAHWFAQQVTIHPIVCYYIAEDKDLNKKQLVTHEVIFISDDLTHDAHMVEHCVTETLRLLLQKVHITNMIQFTDGCSAQYKSRTPFADVSCSEADHGVKIERHFFGSSHGKGPADGCSGVIKAAVSRALKAGTVLNRGSEMYDFCKENLTKSTDTFQRTFVYVEPDKINRNRPDRVTAKTVKGTRQLHAVKPSEPGTLAVRKLSCFCTKCLYDTGECPNADIVDSWKTEDILTKPFKRRSKLPQNDDTAKPTLPQKDDKKKPKLQKTRMPQTDGLEKKGLPQKDDQEEHEKQEANMPDLQSKPETTDNFKESIKLEARAMQDVPVNREHYFSAKLEELNKCRSFDELKRMSMDLKPEFEALFPIQADENINITDKKLASDKVAIQLLPDDVKETCTCQLPVNVVADGNCLPRCGSILAFGHELAHKEIRARIAVELACNESIYTDNRYLNRGVTLPENERKNLCKTYTMFSDKYMNEEITTTTIKQIYRAETLEVPKLGSFMGIWQVFALSTVLKCPLRSIYPSLGSAVPRLLLNRLILPASQSLSAEVKVMWSSLRTNLMDEHWIPNHFVPVLFTHKITAAADFYDDMDTSFSLTDVVDSEDFIAKAVGDMLCEGSPGLFTDISGHPETDTYLESTANLDQDLLLTLEEQSSGLKRVESSIAGDHPVNLEFELYHIYDKFASPVISNMTFEDQPACSDSNSQSPIIDDQSARPANFSQSSTTGQSTSLEEEQKSSTETDTMDNSDLVKRYAVGQFVLAQHGNQKLPAVVVQAPEGMGTPDIGLWIQYFRKAARRNQWTMEEKPFFLETADVAASLDFPNITAAGERLYYKFDI